MWLVRVAVNRISAKFCLTPRRRRFLEPLIINSVPVHSAHICERGLRTQKSECYLGHAN